MLKHKAGVRNAIYFCATTSRRMSVSYSSWVCVCVWLTSSVPSSKLLAVTVTVLPVIPGRQTKSAKNKTKNKTKIKPQKPPDIIRALCSFSRKTYLLPITDMSINDNITVCAECFCSRLWKKTQGRPKSQEIEDKTLQRELESKYSAWILTVNWLCHREDVSEGPSLLWVSANVTGESSQGVNNLGCAKVLNNKWTCWI